MEALVVKLDRKADLNPQIAASLSASTAVPFAIAVNKSAHYDRPRFAACPRCPPGNSQVPPFAIHSVSIQLGFQIVRHCCRITARRHLSEWHSDTAA